MLLESRRQPQEEVVAPLTSGVKVGQTHTRCCIKESQIAEREIAGRKRFMRSPLCKFASLPCARPVRACVCKEGANLSSSKGSRLYSPAVTAECTGR